ncbi:aspartate-semialdehyde dehydrogenase [bacterium]|nr:aspartate-semialdehyde dehydrogenase [bacterium]
MNQYNSEKKIPVGVLGATGMVGQRFVSLLADHPWFELSVVAASSRSAGQSYRDAVEGRWSLNTPIPENIGNLKVYEVEADMGKIADQIDFAFSAMSLDKSKVREVEDRYAEMDIPVVSANSAHRWTEDVPMIIPEINPHHVELIDIQRKNRNWGKGCIAVKPNCSIQSYVPVLEALKSFGLEKVIVSTYQAISGAGKTFKSWPEMEDNVIPFIGGEEKKSEDEPMKIWGEIKNSKLVLAEKPIISATCIRVPVTDGHMATVNVELRKNPAKEELIDTIKQFQNPIESLHLPSSPEAFMTYFEEDDRPQTALDRDLGRGMGIGVGRLREDPVLGWKFVALSHNTLRGAAGGAVLVAELLMEKGYITQ